MIDRKTFIVQLAAGLLAAPLIRAQQAGKLIRIGVVRAFYEPIPPPVPPPGGWEIDKAMRSLGWIEGENFVFETRWAGPNPQRLREAAAELKALPVALIVAPSSTVIKAVLDAAPGMPVVMVAAGDAVALGFVASLAHPGGDVTGTTVPGPEMYGKQLELLAQMVPQAKRIGVLMNPSNPASELFHQAMLLRAKSLGVELDRIEVSAPEQLEPAIARATGRALLVVASPMFSIQLARIVELTLQFRIPSMHYGRYSADAGGLMSFDARQSWYWRKAAFYIDKILKGAKPGDLPIEQPTEFEFVINAKTAKALGITIPQSLLLRADHVIQ